MRKNLLRHIAAAAMTPSHAARTATAIVISRRSISATATVRALPTQSTAPAASAPSVSTPTARTSPAQQSGPLAVEPVRGARVIKTAPPDEKCGTLLDDDEEDTVSMVDPATGEWGGPTKGGKQPEPTRFGDWERKGRCTDF